MADTLKFRGGSTSDIASSTVSDREIVFDTDKNTLVLGSAKDYLMRYGGNSQSGNVGIGTDSPTYRLTIKETTPEGITSKFSQGGDANFQLVAANGTALNLTGQEVSRFGINYEGQGWNSYLSFLRGPSATTGSIAFTTSQQEAIRITSAGLVGIGTSNPSTALDVSGTVTATAFAGPVTGNVTGNSSTATALQNARTINGVSFDGTANITISTGTNANQTLDTTSNVTFASVTAPLTGDVTGNADTATTLQTARTIGGVSFDGSANINLPGVNTSGTQDTSGNAATATTLATARNINGTSFNGSADIVIGNIPQNSQTSAYTLVAADAGKHVNITTGGVTVPSSVFSVGDAVSIYNDSASDQTIVAADAGTQGSSVTLRKAGTATTGNRTLVQYGICTVLCVASNEFVITGVGVT